VSVSSAEEPQPSNTTPVDDNNQGTSSYDDNQQVSVSSDDGPQSNTDSSTSSTFDPYDGVSIPPPPVIDENDDVDTKVSSSSLTFGSGDISEPIISAPIPPDLQAMMAEDDSDGYVEEVYSYTILVSGEIYTTYATTRRAIGNSSDAQSAFKSYGPAAMTVIAAVAGFMLLF
ncbi:hypothetical protein LPJ66_011467, partial [Kickxella alabastrina]